MLPLPSIPRAALGPIAFGALLVIIAWAYVNLRPPPTRFAPSSAVAPPVMVGQAPPAPGVATATPVPLSGAAIALGGGLTLSVADGLFDEQQQARLRVELDRALDYVVARFGTAPIATIGTYVGLAPGCGLHGIAYTDVRTVQVFTCRDLPMARAVNILAHEFVHQLAHDRYGDRHLRADLILSEGVATWGAGAYWLGGASDFRGFVRPWVSRGEQLPLALSYVGLPISDMNKLYYQWASFVEYLIDSYGRERFDALYLSGNAAPGSADYQGIYGKGLDQLEAEWRAWVLQ
ncbi:MAG: hypothetical protein AB4911_00500 [Oscillochloridaceae bacterium umkhey_bin13]